MIIVRFADDIVAGFEYEIDARRFWDAMRKRLQDFSLTLHKTRLIEFGRHAATRRKQRGLGKPETSNAVNTAISRVETRRDRPQPSARVYLRIQKAGPFSRPRCATLPVMLGFARSPAADGCGAPAIS
jgi:hypothetical protein